MAAGGNPRVKFLPIVQTMGWSGTLQCGECAGGCQRRRAGRFPAASRKIGADHCNMHCEAVMHIDHYRDVIIRAVLDGNDDLIDSIAARLADSAEALLILRANGYGGSGMTVSATARQVPMLGATDT